MGTSTTTKEKKCTIEIISTFAANILLAVGETPSFLIDLAKMIYS